MNEINNEMKLNMNDLENVVGGDANCGPTDWLLNHLGLSEYVRYAGGWSLTDFYYDTNRGNGNWKNVGSDDMLRYVARTIGENDPRYVALRDYCSTGTCRYNGWGYADGGHTWKIN